jgi:hypothetical protein
MAQQTLERRKLNEEIEDTFIDGAKAASNMEMKMFNGQGNITGDLKDFYSNFNYLFRLTSNLQEMESKKEGDEVAVLKKKVAGWMQQKTSGITNDRLEAVARTGLNLFDEYYHMLMHVGIIALPTRKG